MMKDTFPGWYAKTPEELKALWDPAIIVPDTNILLHLIRHSANVRAQLMAVFERKKEALWIPYQVARSSSVADSMFSSRLSTPMTGSRRTEDFRQSGAEQAESVSCSPGDRDRPRTGHA